MAGTELRPDVHAFGPWPGHFAVLLPLVWRTLTLTWRLKRRLVTSGGYKTVGQRLATTSGECSSSPPPSQGEGPGKRRPGAGRGAYLVGRRLAPLGRVGHGLGRGRPLRAGAHRCRGSARPPIC